MTTGGGGDGNVWIAIAAKILPMIGGMFRDKDYPWAQGTINIYNGRAIKEVVQVLDGSSSAEWNTLTNQLVSQINAQFAAQGLLDKRGVTLSHISIGQASGRPRSKLGTGFYVAIPGGTFNEGVTNGSTGILDIMDAVQRFFWLLSNNISGVPRGYNILDDAKPLPDPVVTETVVVATNVVNSEVLTTINELSSRVDSAVSLVARQNDEHLDNIIRILTGQLGTVEDRTDELLTRAIQTILDLVLRSTNASEEMHRNATRRVADAAEQSIILADIGSRNIEEKAIINLESLDQAARAAIDTIERVAVEGLEAQTRSVEEAVFDSETRYASFVDTKIPELETPGLGTGTGILTRLPKGLNPWQIAIGIALGILARLFAEDEPTPTDRGEGDVKDEAPLPPQEPVNVRNLLKTGADLIDLGDYGCFELNEIDENSPETGKQFYRLIINLFAVIAYSTTRAGREAEACLLDWTAENPYLPMSPGDAALAYHRAIIDKEEALLDIRKSGFREEDAAAMLEISKTIPDLGLLLTMWFRDLLNDNQLTQALVGKGFEPKYVPLIKEAAFFIPPVQDIIQFAVKEVFNPVVAAQFGQFDEFPEEFADLSKQQGVSRKFAEYYWAAHWALPSIQMGYEMFHRRIIDRQKLENLFIALDIMPGWRTDLVELSYNPLTRVDVRRMNKVGVLTSQQVYEAYLDLGYSPKNARLLEDFVKEYNFPEETLQEELANDLTRSNIIAFYRNGIINRATAALFLSNSGVNAIAAALFLDDADFKEELSDRKAEQAVILESAKIGNITLEEARAQLDTLGLETAERDKALVKLERVIQANVKQPSKADMDKFLANDLVTPNEYRLQMQRLGYSDYWIDKYVQLAELGESSDKE